MDTDIDIFLVQYIFVSVYNTCMMRRYLIGTGLLKIKHVRSHAKGKIS
jgi:hypothetical protein